MGSGGMQVTEAERVFRDYVKKLYGRFFLRRERLLGREGHPEFSIPTTRNALLSELMAEYTPLSRSQNSYNRNSSSNRRQVPCTSTFWLQD